MTGASVTPEQFSKEGLKHKDGTPYQPTETQLRFLREQAAKGQQLLRKDADALNALHRPYRS